MFIQHFIIVIALLIASYIDLRIKEVPDLLSNGLIFIGLVIAILIGIIDWSFWPIIYSLAGITIGAIFGMLMYYTGQWGGGDAKLLIGMGAVFGAKIFFFKFLILLLIAGAIYGLLFSAYIAIKRRKKFIKSFRKRAYTPTIKLLRRIVQFIAIISLLLAFFFFKELSTKIIIVFIALIIYLLLYLWLFSKTIEDIFKIRVPVDKLVEGDWVIEDIIVLNNKINKKNYKNENYLNKGYKKINNYDRINNINKNDYKKVVISKTGITKKEIALLKKLNIKSVLVKDGIPFVPSFLLGYLLIILINYLGIKFFF